MTATTTRLAEIAERLKSPQFSMSEEEVFNDFWFSVGLVLEQPKVASLKSWMHRAEFAADMREDLAADVSYLLAQLTAAQARSREDAEIMRVAAQALEQGHAYRVCHCVYCLGPEGDARGQHKPDCIVTKLRARADELEGRTDG